MLHFWREFKIIQASGGDKVPISLAVNPDYTVNVKANGSSISNGLRLAKSRSLEKLVPSSWSTSMRL